jgi:ssDNA-binding Zn-finger/Zn-ribbon topoisomerase 1
VSVQSIACAECGSPMVLRVTMKHHYGDGTPRKFYGCSRWPACGGVHGAHPDGSPLGTPATADVRAARVRAHATFDAAWQRLGMTRKEGYGWLQFLTGLNEPDAHIGRFTREQCVELLDILGDRRETRP